MSCLLLSRLTVLSEYPQLEVYPTSRSQVAGGGTQCRTGQVTERVAAADEQGKSGVGPNTSMLLYQRA
jgi:hypothetical protein